MYSTDSMNIPLQVILSVLLGAVVVVNGVAVNVDDLLSEARNTVNQANVHQIATVLELYYMDNNEYPPASGGEELFNLLEKEGYIMNRPLDPRVFGYEPRLSGEDYTLKLK